MSEQITRPPFKVAGIATIKHLNVRKEGPDDEKILAVDVKLSIANIDRRLCSYFDDALESFLWRGDTDALIVRNAYLQAPSYANWIDDATVEIDLDTFRGCEVKKFSIEPRDGGVITLTCSISLFPSSSDVSSLAKLVQEEARVSIEGPPDLFATQPVAAAVEAKPADAPDAGAIWSEGPDPLLDQATEVVRTNKKASMSLVQRHLKIGYNRAARLMEEMEKAGVVTVMTGSGSRSVVQA